MSDPTVVVGTGLSVVKGFIDRFMGDGNVSLQSDSASKKEWDCDRDEQLRQVCRWRWLNKNVATFRTITYAITSGLGYTSQSFRVKAYGYYDGCDLRGVFLSVSAYGESFIGRTSDWVVKSAALDTPIKGLSGCDDCCPQSTAVAFHLTVSSPGFFKSYHVTVYGNGRVTVRRL